MALSDHYQRAVDEFFSELSAFSNAYRHSSFRYLAIRDGEGFGLLQGVVVLHAEKPRPPREPFRTDDIICGECLLEDMRIDARGFISALIDGSITTPQGALLFQPDNPGSYTTFHMSFDGTASQQRGYASKLNINGANDQWRYIQQPQIERQVKAASTPYNALSHVASDFGLPFERGMYRSVEIRAESVAMIAASSRAHGSTAEVEIHLAPA
jgi:hypothetical protein